jgi:hypothetical protein
MNQIKIGLLYKEKLKIKINFIQNLKILLEVKMAAPASLAKKN